MGKKVKAYAIIFVNKKTNQIEWARICSAFPVAQGRLDEIDQLCIGQAKADRLTNADRKLRTSLSQKCPWLMRLFRAGPRY